MGIMSRVRTGVVLCGGLLLLAGWPPATTSGAVSPGAAARQFTHAVLSASSACESRYALLAGAVQEAVDSPDPGALMGYDGLFNDAQDACAQAQSTVDAIQIPAALGASGAVVVFYNVATRAVQAAMQSLANLTADTASPPPSDSSSHDNDSGMASILAGTIDRDNVAGYFADVHHLARAVVSYVTSPPASGGWTFQALSSLPAAATVTGLACPTATACYAVGAHRLVEATTDGGAHWRRQTTPNDRRLYNLVAVACPAVTTCYAAGAGGAILTTHDGGASWHGSAGNVAANLQTIACPTVTICYALTASPTIVVTRDGGAHWRTYNSLIGAGRRRYDVAKDVGLHLTAMACPSATTCYVVGANQTQDSGPGVILVTRDGGATWRSQRNPLGRNPKAIADIDGVTCPSATTCYAVGYDFNSGEVAILRTSDGGATWHSERYAVDTQFQLTSIACASTTACYAVGGQGSIMATTDGGVTWQDEQSFLTGTNSVLGPVACPTATTCYAGGDTLGDVILATKTGGH